MEDDKLENFDPNSIVKETIVEKIGDAYTEARFRYMTEKQVEIEKSIRVKCSKDPTID